MMAEFEIDGVEVALDEMSKSQLEILFRLCGLRGDTARILKGELIRRIKACDERRVVECVEQMVDDLDFSLDDEGSRKRRKRGDTKPQRTPLTDSLRRQAASHSCPCCGAELRISISKNAG